MARDPSRKVAVTKVGGFQALVRTLVYADSRVPLGRRSASLCSPRRPMFSLPRIGPNLDPGVCCPIPPLVVRSPGDSMKGRHES